MVTTIRAFFRMDFMVSSLFIDTARLNVKTLIIICTSDDNSIGKHSNDCEMNAKNKDIVRKATQNSHDTMHLSVYHRQPNVRVYRFIHMEFIDFTKSIE